MLGLMHPRRHSRPLIKQLQMWARCLGISPITHNKITPQPRRSQEQLGHLSRAEMHRGSCKHSSGLCVECAATCRHGSSTRGRLEWGRGEETPGNVNYGWTVGGSAPWGWNSGGKKTSRPLFNRETKWFSDVPLCVGDDNVLFLILLFHELLSHLAHGEWRPVSFRSLLHCMWWSPGTCENRTSSCLGGAAGEFAWFQCQPLDFQSKGLEHGVTKEVCIIHSLPGRETASPPS